ncbi:MAG: CBS domain-containing protein [Bryobacteraceae bacterium]
MKVQEIMTADPAFCTPETRLPEVAKLMVRFDCGEIPVVDSQQSRKPIGVITDRDITCRTVAEEKNPLMMTARDCMSAPVITATPNTPAEECAHLMEEHKVRRVPVVDTSGRLCGIVSQADIAQKIGRELAGEVVERVSERSPEPSLVGS